MDKTIYREQSDGMQQQQQQQQQPLPPQHRQHLEPMNIPLGQGVPPASGMPPHHLGPEHHVQQASRARHRSVNSPSGESAADKKTRGRVRIRMEFISNISEVHDFQQEENWNHEKGVRVKHPNWNTSNVASRF